MKWADAIKIGVLFQILGQLQTGTLLGVLDMTVAAVFLLAAGVIWGKSKP